MPHFSNDEILLRIMPLAVRDVVEDDKDARAIVIGMDEAPRIDEECTLPDCWKFVCYFEVDNSGSFWNNRGD